jgi:cell division initiation protein
MLAPSEIDNMRFSKTIKGYNVDEVDDFLDQLTADYERLYKENAEYKDKFEQMEKELGQYKQMEHTLQNTLVVAQTAAGDIKNTAQKQAEQIIRDAQTEARRSVDELNKQEYEVTKKIEEMKKSFEVTKAKMEALLIAQLEMLQDDRKNEGQ